MFTALTAFFKTVLLASISFSANASGLQAPSLNCPAETTPHLSCINADDLGKPPSPLQQMVLVCRMKNQPEVWMMFTGSPTDTLALDEGVPVSREVSSVPSETYTFHDPLVGLTMKLAIANGPSENQNANAIFTIEGGESAGFLPGYLPMICQ